MTIHTSDPDVPECFQGDIVVAGLTDQDDQPGYMALRGVDCSNARNMKYSIERQVGVNVQIRSIVRGISEDAAAMICVVLDNTHANDVVSREAVVNLLKFKAITGVSDKARQQFADAVPQLLAEKYRPRDALPALGQLIAAYAKIGKDPVGFADVAEVLTKNMRPGVRLNLLMYFHLLMRGDLPEIIEQVDGEEVN